MASPLDDDYSSLLLRADDDESNTISQALRNARLTLDPISPSPVGRSRPTPTVAPDSYVVDAILAQPGAQMVAETFMPRRPPAPPPTGRLTTRVTSTTTRPTATATTTTQGTRVHTRARDRARRERRTRARPAAELSERLELHDPPVFGSPSPPPPPPPSSSPHPARQQDIRRILRLLREDEDQRIEGRNIQAVTHTNTITTVFKDGRPPQVRRTSTRTSAPTPPPPPPRRRRRQQR